MSEVECIACEDTGYEAGMPGYYCTFCKAGCKVATELMKRGIDPGDPFGTERRERERELADADGGDTRWEGAYDLEGS